MSMTIEKAIDELGGYIGVNDDIYDYELKELWPALELAVTALREKAERENPKPLTIEELQHMNDQPVYVVPLPASGRSKAWEEWCVMGNDEAFIPGIDDVNWKLTDYNRTWIAYRHKPKEDAE